MSLSEARLDRPPPDSTITPKVFQDWLTTWGFAQSPAALGSKVAVGMRCGWEAEWHLPDPSGEFTSQPIYDPESAGKARMDTMAQGTTPGPQRTNQIPHILPKLS